MPPMLNIDRKVIFYYYGCKAGSYLWVKSQVCILEPGRGKAWEHSKVGS